MPLFWLLLAAIVLVPPQIIAAETVSPTALAALPAPPSPPENPTTPEKVELGKMLFFDRRLSGDGTMSCATCHNPEAGFADALPISSLLPHHPELAELPRARECRLPEDPLPGRPPPPRSRSRPSSR